MEIQALNLLNPDTLSLPPHQLALLWPYLIVFLGTCVAMMLSVYSVTKPAISVPVVTILSLVGGLISSITLIEQPAQALFGGMLLSDPFSCYANVLFIASGIFVSLFSHKYLEKQGLNYSEYYLLIALSVLGMMLMASSLNLIIIFIALELMSLSVYVLVGFRRNDRRSNEAAVKYYILGSAASAVMLYGAALLYGASLSVDIREIAARVAQSGALFNPMLLIGLMCVLIGFLFKVASVPFHMWMPDVYEGAPTPVTAFMTTGLKAAVFITLLRIMVSLSGAPVLTGNMAAVFHNLLWISAILTMFIGNVIALQQTNLKRLLAYSSIAHSGYLLIGLLSGAMGADGFTAVLFYVMVYAIMNLGAFAVLTVLSLQGDSGLELSDLSGLSQRHPWLAFAMAVFMFSMAGLPPTAGFTSKYFLFYSGVQAGEIWLVVLAVLCSAIAAYYYLRVIVFMYMRDPIGQVAAAPIHAAKGAVITLAVMLLLILQLGVAPSTALRFVGQVLKAAPPTTTAAAVR